MCSRWRTILKSPVTIAPGKESEHLDPPGNKNPIEVKNVLYPGWLHLLLIVRNSSPGGFHEQYCFQASSHVE